MLEWTGERFLPWRNDPSLAYEHIHRYFYASRFVAGKSVLDLACGEGYGSHLLAQTAAKVVGVDIDPEVVRHAANRYGAGNLTFLTGSITKVPVPESYGFDLIVCFEAIEHIEDHQSLLSEISRLLKPDGVLLVSTPNKKVYDESIPEENVFHVKELEFDEFRALLEPRFKHVKFLGQRIYAQSNLWPVDSKVRERLLEFFIERRESEFVAAPPTDRLPLYYIAVATNAAVPPELEPSVLVDNGNELLNEKDRELKLSAEAIAWKGEQIGELEKGLAWREEQLRKTEEDLKWTTSVIEDLRAVISTHEEALAWRAHQVDDLDKEKTALTAALRSTQNLLAQTTSELEAIHVSSGWKFILKLRQLRQRFLPEGTSRRGLFDRLIRR
jgi:SAM-dependent methyltransferase